MRRVLSARRAPNAREKREKVESGVEWRKGTPGMRTQKLLKCPAIVQVSQKWVSIAKRVIFGGLLHGSLFCL